MEFIIREMQTGEAKLLQKNGSSAFLHSLEAPFMPKPKDALVAELNGEVVGCFSYSIKNYERKKVGYCDYLYVDAAHAGKGIASKLCEEGVNHLWTQGCDYLTASVRDDNVGSWTAFEKHGFVRAKTPKMISAIGLAGYLSLSISSLQGIAGYSCDFFIAAAAAQPHSADDMHSKLMHTSRSHEQFSMQQKEGGFGQLLLHLLTNFGLLMIPVIVGIIFSNLDFSYFFTNNFLAFLISSLIVLGGVIFFSFLGTLLSKRSWSYRMAIGGILLSIPISFLGVFMPLVGNWYPARYENTRKFKRDMAITAFLPWLSLLSFRFVMGIDNLIGDFDFLDSGLLLGLTNVLLILRCIPFLTFNHGSSRIFKYNKILWVVMVLMSLFVVIFW